PMNIGAILQFDAQGGPAWTTVVELLSARVPTIPRLRQRLRRVPIGCGRPLWVDDPDFRLDRHLIRRAWLPPGGDRELLDVAADLLCQRLPTDRPLWLACLVIDPAGWRTALVLVLHHVLADGLGGLAILAALADPGIQLPSRAFPQPPPQRSEMAVDAAREIRAATTLPARLRRSRAGLRELGLGPTRPHLVEKTSLNRPTLNRRRLATVSVPLADIVAAAHSAGGTVNDVVLAAVTGALISELHAGGEHPSRLVVSVPVSGRHSTTANRLGNNTGVRPIAVPTLVDDHARLAGIISLTRASPELARASSAGPLGLAFRALSRLGLFQPFINHQRLVHTFETNMRGPVAPMSFGGHQVAAVVPAAVNPGNIGVSFDALSYAGVLTITVVADPHIVPQLDQVAHSLNAVYTHLA
ncbi:MAG TPA: wax ester/triacylglycerol synthase domain-containing protein, partial [Microlunatus sp.]